MAMVVFRKCFGYQQTLKYDEDETHPNIDTPSLFRWRHQARIDRMEDMERKRQEIKSRKQSNASKIKELESKIGCDDDELKILKQLKIEAKKLEEEEEELKKRENKTPWNVDTISKPGFEKTLLNKPSIRTVEPLSEEERERQAKKFIKDNESLMKRYGMLRKYEDSKRFLLQNHHLVCEDTANYLVIWSINLEMEKKHDLMAHVAHQCICMQYILELSKQLEVDPRACVSSFFAKIQNAIVEYKEQFENEIEEFKRRIQRRAEEKIQEAIAEQEEEAQRARIGPGGLDPVEVFESLPEALQKCFESRDVKLLQEMIALMPEEQARYHMKRCVDSGLWIPDSGVVHKNQSDNDQDENVANIENVEFQVASRDNK